MNSQYTCPECDSPNTREIDAAKAECLRCGEVFVIVREELERAA